VTQAAAPRVDDGPGPGVLAPPVLLRSVGLTKVFQANSGPVHAVRGVDLSVHRAEFVAVMGPSGSGKSTLLHVLGGLEPPTGGEIWLDGQRVDGFSQARWAVLRRRQIGFVFQFFNLVSNMTAADNVELAALIGGASRRQAQARREELFGDLDLTAQADLAPAQLSGGEQQRVALARALAHQPSLLFADEPTGNLDSTNSSSVLRLLCRSHAAGQAILLVTHDARAASMADRVINLFDGMIADDAPLPSLQPLRATTRDVLELRG
jgi:putative ABC transport system ATP-binding protein